jgi:hypothetical protein
VFLTLLFHRRWKIEDGQDIIDRWDWTVSRKMVGRDFNTTPHLRPLYIGCCGVDGQKHLHTHLLIKLPGGTDLDRFERICEDSFKKVGEDFRLSKLEEVSVYQEKWWTRPFGGRVHLETPPGNRSDQDGVVIYTTLPRHLQWVENGLDTSSVVISRNYGTMTN